ncbi:MAG: hypothetical protein KC561_09380 [Myxococcales bacterium]|nr:hypothetical protein [Myxococcales bacterium]
MSCARAVLLAMILGALSGCAEEAVDPCECPDGQCPEDVCALSVQIPAACASATVLLNGVEDGRASVGTTYNTCAGVGSGESATLAIAGHDATGNATCPAGGGQVVPAGLCTLRFELAESCRELAPDGTVTVGGHPAGDVYVDSPLIPCAFLAVGESTSASIAAGQYVLTTTVSCPSAGGQSQLIMECQ